MSGNSVTPDGDKLRRLRTARGWRVEDLARKARCAPKSVENAERNKNVRLPTLAVIARALGVEPGELIAEAAAPAGLVRVEIKMEANLKELNQSPELHSLLELLTTMLTATKQITILDVKAGSVFVSLAMDSADALRLVALSPELGEAVRDVVRAKVEEASGRTSDYVEVLLREVYRKPDGGYYTRSADETSHSRRLAYLTDMLVLGEAVTQIVVRPDDNEPPRALEGLVARMNYKLEKFPGRAHRFDPRYASPKTKLEQSISADVLIMAGCPLEDIRTSS